MIERKGAFFDVDGTLLNTYDLVYGGIEYSISFHGLVVPSREEISVVVANPIRTCYNLLVPGADIEKLVEAHDEFQDNNPHLVVPFAETLQVLEEIKAKGLNIAAITSRNSKGSLRFLQAVGVDHFFDLIVGADDVTNHKPDPEGINSALKHFDLNPSQVHMIGDTHPDVLAGKAAGVKTIGVTYGFDGENIRKSEPDHVVDNLAQILPIVLA